MFAHLHCHFSGSYSDSLLAPEKDLDYLAALGHRAVGLTDHGELAWAPGFHRECRRRGLHPVVGCEFYFVPSAAEAIEKGDPSRFHLILLARDDEGWRNLILINNAAWLDNCFRGIRGLVDWKLLQKHHRGLAALSACFWGSLPQALIRGGIEAGRKELHRYLDIFGRDFHPELQRHGIADEEIANRGMGELARSCALRPVVTNDCHYRLRSDWRAHDVLIKTRFGRPTAFALEARDYFLRSARQMARLGFPRGWLRNSLELALSCAADPAVSLPAPVPGAGAGEGTAVYGNRVIRISPGEAWKAAAAVNGRVRDEDGIEEPPPGLTLEEAADRGGEWGRRRSEDPELFGIARTLAGAPRGSVPDRNFRCRAPAETLRSHLPLRRSGGEIILQYPPEEARRIPGLFASAGPV